MKYLNYNEIFEILKNKHVQTNLNNIAEKYKHQKILLYGAGIFFDVLYDNFDLTQLNIIGIADRNFTANDSEYKNIKTIKPEEIHQINPDLILITTYNPSVIEDYFNKTLFKNKKKYKSIPVFREKLFIIEKILGLKKKIFQSPYEKNMITIEISGCCNAKCSYCPTGVGKHSGESNFMSPELFEKILLHLIDVEVLNAEITKVIDLYNWGEPLIHPNINEILSIMQKYKLKAHISSNFIKFPEISEENYKTIHSTTFSLCSFDKEKYKKIYKANLDKVLENYDKFLEKQKAHNPRMELYINWLRYKFNNEEFDFAKKYFQKRGLGNKISKNYFAMLSDMQAWLSLAENKEKGNNIDHIPYYNLAQAREDIDFKRENKIIEKYAPNPKNFKCPQFKNLVINESGFLVGCCGIHSKMPEYNLGNILNLNKKDIYRLENSMKICQKCNKYSLDWFGSNCYKFNENGKPDNAYNTD